MYVKTAVIDIHLDLFETFTSLSVTYFVMPSKFGSLKRRLQKNLLLLKRIHFF